MGRITLILAFAFTVMADPVSSVAYAIEGALRSLDGDLAPLLPTMTAIVAISTTYHELIGRFPGGVRMRTRAVGAEPLATRSPRQRAT